MIEYPKRLYLGPYRVPVDVGTADEEAVQRDAFNDPAPDEKEPDVKASKAKKETVR